jgi:hypothetical protein
MKSTMLLSKTTPTSSLPFWQQTFFKKGVLPGKASPFIDKTPSFANQLVAYIHWAVDEPTVADWHYDAVSPEQLTMAPSLSPEKLSVEQRKGSNSIEEDSLHKLLIDWTTTGNRSVYSDADSVNGYKQSFLFFNIYSTSGHQTSFALDQPKRVFVSSIWLWATVNSLVSFYRGVHMYDERSRHYPEFTKYNEILYACKIYSYRMKITQLTD